MTSELKTFNHLRCHSSSTALGTKTGYWKPTRRVTNETPRSRLCLWPTIFVWSLLSTPHFPGAQYHQIVTGATVKLTPSDKKKVGTAPNRHEYHSKRNLLFIDIHFLLAYIRLFYLNGLQTFFFVKNLRSDILRGPQKFGTSSSFDLTLQVTSRKWDKFLWPFQNIWTLVSHTVILSEWTLKKWVSPVLPSILSRDS